ncbi:hypothetical protein [Oceanirhabdus seepicola]|uniref:Uncharacterized protein n=1 Tax=Oceanirhabdus seepicola TaxID=2828781 RepID=A0A9J6P8F7_9CLOT|nr:hypothetical protein [Oceanirhabdus seepicola]MCM1991736.1 hypothetical protein [Oceanirhabdus seepicola]
MNFQWKEVMYKEKIRSIEIKNQFYKLYVALDFGIRILSFQTNHGENFLGEDIPIEMDVYDDKWRMYGGHRLWHAPEAYPRTYIPDNKPVNFNILDDCVEIIQDVELHTNIQKRILIRFINDGREVEIKNIISNKNVWKIRTAAWALTVMRKGGEALIPLSKRQEKFLSTRHLEVWPYTDLNDKRLNLEKDFIYLEQRDDIEEPFKLGTNNEEGWAGYKLGEEVFIKRFEHELGKIYPDNGCSFEVYTNKHILELETLSPIIDIEPNESIEHTEIWSIVKDREFNGDI